MKINKGLKLTSHTKEELNKALQQAWDSIQKEINEIGYLNYLVKGL